jgi:PII-like signaling protein
MATQVAHDLTTACRVADVDGVFEVEMLGQSRQVVGVVIHVVAITGLRGATMSAPVMGYYSITVLKEEQHLRVPIVG